MSLRAVSVPWRGLRSFGLCRPHVYRAAVGKFPSPGGDYGLSDGAGDLLRALRGVKFPSPGGDYGLSDPVYKLDGLVFLLSFRPLAGITVFRTCPRLRDPVQLLLVSVPWRGLRSLGPMRGRARATPRSSFPSPGGDYGLSDPFHSPLRAVFCLGFRPLAGGFDQSNDWLRFFVTSA